jgi:hypothetical protein
MHVQARSERRQAMDDLLYSKDGLRVLPALMRAGFSGALRVPLRE